MARIRPGGGNIRGRRLVLSGWLMTGLFLLLVLLVLNAGLFMTYRQVRQTIEDELGARLMAIACATAAGIEGDQMSLLVEDPTNAVSEELQLRLSRISFDTDLGEIYLFDDIYRQLLSDRQGFDPDYNNSALDLHFGAATAALAGVAATSDLYRVGPIYLKTAFAPIFDNDELAIGAVGVEGGSDFFAGLWTLRRQVLINALAGVLAILALAVLFFRLRRTEAIAVRTLRETAALAAAGELAAILAHEIRNPLAIISARSERIRAKIEKGQSREEILEWFAAIPREVDRLNGTLTQYLSYARPIDMGDDSVEIGIALDAAFSFLREDFRRKGIELIPPDGQWRSLALSIAPAALHQILLNLMLNARDAMTAGGSLTLSIDRKDKLIWIRITDTGCGMSKEQQKRAFDSFFTTKEHGSGLGLATVRSMIELYGGEIVLESELDKGTTFTLNLLVAEEATSDQSLPLEER